MLTLGNVFSALEGSFSTRLVTSYHVEISNGNTVFASVNLVANPENESFPDSINVGDIDLQLSSINSNGFSTMLGYYGTQEKQYASISKGYIFKTIYSGLIELAEKLELESITSYAQSITEDLIIKECSNPYLNGCGFSISEILSTLGIQISIPFNFDMNVIEFRVPTGANPIAVIKSLIPIPFLKIVEIDGMLFASLPQVSSTSPSVEGCGTYVNVRKLKEIGNCSVKGSLSTPINISSMFTGQTETKRFTDENGNSVEIEYMKNSLGGVYAILHKVIAYNRSQELNT
jgi:hypothetical protein